jgi:hypothetical protein
LDSKSCVSSRCGYPRQVEGLDRKLVSLFDEAVGKYERRDYRGAIALCRDIRNLVEQDLGATQATPVAVLLAGERGLPPESPPIQFVPRAWKLFADTTNDAHHVQGGRRLHGR